MGSKNRKLGKKRERTQLPLQKGRGGENVRLRKSVCRELHVLKAEAVKSWQIPLSRIWRCLGTCLLLPLCMVTAMAFAACFGASMEASFWRSAPFWFFMMGMALWGVAFFGLGRPTYLYVWSHEATHALATWLCLGRVHEFRVTREGGHIVTNKNNLLIALSPYFIPLYALIVAFVFWLVGSYVDLRTPFELPLSVMPRLSWQRIGYLILGLTWGFHITFTIWMIAKDQPDLRDNGTVFSLNVIILANLLLLSLLLIQASPTISWVDFFDRWMHAAHRILTGAASLAGWLQQSLADASAASLRTAG